ncbi:MAG: biopolymer transporter ExbD, partial [Terriglobales bacterium]
MAIMLSTRGVSAEMNVTPLVDVLLVLLVIFMLITPPTNPHGLDAKLPQDSPIETQAKQLDQTIVLRVMRGMGEEASIRINREDVTWADLRVR